ncbi:unnamed protein product [Nippostrongylus brasiliensis]|uniref:Endo/exonuclease/phosphatase domain-containing protein n=1 Tax=Nippostrongylus brasiliensis TaxID=27835 RepID=A0A0N4XWY4_NIPBR|nr:unnamed protein product [Nippostrongylus brasiliensis]
MNEGGVLDNNISLRTQTGCPEKNKDEFYVALNDVIRYVPDGDFLPIAGDLNGHGPTAEDRPQRRGFMKEEELLSKIETVDEFWTWLSSTTLQSAARSLPKEKARR